MSVFRQEKEIKKHPNGKGKSKTISIYRWHDLVCRKSYKSTKNIIELINELNKVAEYKINIQKPIVFLQL